MTKSDRRLQDLGRIGSEMATIQDRNALLLKVVQAAKELMGATYSSIALVEDEWLCWHSAAGKPIEEVRGYRQSLETGLCGWVARNGIGRRSDDVLKEADYLPQYAEMRSEIDVPLLRGGVVIGVLNAESPEVAAFTAQDQDLLQVLAALATLAL